MSTVLIQPTFHEVINDIENGVVVEEEFYINFVPTNDLEDGKLHEEIVNVKLNKGKLEFQSQSNKLTFKKLEEDLYEIELEDNIYTIISPKRVIHTNIDHSTSFDISPQEDLFLVGDSKGSLTIGNTSDGTITTSIEEAHFSSITKSLFFPSGKVALTTSLDMTIKIWDVIDGSNPRTFTGHKQRITDLAMIERGRNFLSSGKDGLIKLWDCASGQNISTLQRSNSLRDGVNVIKVCIDSNNISNESTTGNEFGTSGKTLFVGHTSGVITQFDLRSKEETLNFNSLFGEVTALEEVNETSLLGGYSNGIMALWDKRSTSEPIKQINIKSGIISISLKTSDDIFVSQEPGIISKYTEDLNEWDNFSLGGTTNNNELLLSRRERIYTIGSGDGSIYEVY